MLISMPTGTSTIFGVFQLIPSSHEVRREHRAELQPRTATKAAQVRKSSEGLASQPTFPSWAKRLLCKTRSSDCFRKSEAAASSLVEGTASLMRRDTGCGIELFSEKWRLTRWTNASSQQVSAMCCTVAFAELSRGHELAVHSPEDVNEREIKFDFVVQGSATRCGMDRRLPSLQRAVSILQLWCTLPLCMSRSTCIETQL